MLVLLSEHASLLLAVGSAGSSSCVSGGSRVPLVE